MVLLVVVVIREGGRSQILAELRRELHGETITDPQLVKSALSMLVELSDIQTLSGQTETGIEQCSRWETNLGSS